MQSADGVDGTPAETLMDATGISIGAQCVAHSHVASGTLVWAKIKGYPWWPAEVSSLTALAQSWLSTSTDAQVMVDDGTHGDPKPGQVLCLFFFDKTHAFVSADAREPFTPANCHRPPSGPAVSTAGKSLKKVHVQL